MVLAQRVGQKRSFWVGLLLVIVTFGIYAVYWNYKVHNEAYRQFELQRENRDEGMVWYVLGLVVPPFLLAYLWVMASNVAYVRQRIGLRPRMTGARFVTLIGAGLGLFVVGVILLEIAFVAAESAGVDALDAAMAASGAVFFGLTVGAAVLIGVGYYYLQKDINELWDAYSIRMDYLRTHPEAIQPARPIGAPMPDHAAGSFAQVEAERPHAPEPTYFADRAAEGPAKRLRHELDALLAEHPQLAEAELLDGLVARAEQGEGLAMLEADERLQDLRARLQEFAALRARRDELAARAEHEPTAAPQRELLEERLRVLESQLFEP